jgi:hypothetical protein
MNNRFLGFAVGVVGLLGSGSASAAEMSPLHVVGNRILDASGHAVRLCGVNTACMEWSSDGEGHVLETVRVAIKDWHVNIIRLPLSQDRWFGQTHPVSFAGQTIPGQTDKGVAYRALVRQVVDYCASHGCYILLDLHWNDCGVWGENIGQHVMPDRNSVTFWKSCAREYRNEPAVLFDLYNEPHNTTWDIWLRGGEIKETTGPGARQGRFVPVTYQTPGMQAMLDAVRGTGARNVVVCGGLDWAYDLSGFLSGYALKDPDGQGVIYACHAYNNKGQTIDTWLSHLDAALPHFPVIMSEFGGQNVGPTAGQPNAWVDRVLKEMDKRRCHYIAWDLHPAAGPTLVSDWKYTPTPSFGVLVKASLARR